VFIKIPATVEGLKAIEDTIAGGIPVNVTLIFSLERHRKVAEAYIRGVKRLVDRGGDPKTVASVASFFVSRVDTEADRRLDEIGGHDELKGKLAIANAKLAYQTYREVFMTPEWEELEKKGASQQRCLWASTSTKNPEYQRRPSTSRSSSGRTRSTTIAARDGRGGRGPRRDAAATRCSRTRRAPRASSISSSRPASLRRGPCKGAREEGVESSPSPSPT
jgi:transaldolase